MNLVQAIRTSPWMIDPRTLEAYLPLAMKLLSGEQVDFNQPEASKPYLVNKQGRTVNAPSADGAVMVYEVSGVITKHDQECGPTGTITLLRNILLADQRESVTGHLLLIDSGGGEGTNLETVARTIREYVTKPVVVHYNGMMCSAAYYIASGADEIYAAEPTDLAGSIGVMASWADIRPMYEAQGVKFHEVYATASDLKNEDWREALAGDYDKLRQSFLDPYAEQFIATVKEFRPALQEEDAFRGQVYMAPQAAEIGMIDGVLTYEAAVARVYELAAQRRQSQSDFSTPNNIAMDKIQAVLGYELEQQDGGVFLRSEELAMIEAAMVAPDEQAVKTESLNEKLDAILAKVDDNATKITALSAQVLTQAERLDEEVNAINEKIDAVRQLPGAAPAAAHAEADDNGDDPLEALNAQLRAGAQDGMVRITK